MCLSKKTKEKIKNLEKLVRESLKIIIAERDKLRESLSELNDIDNSISDALEDLQSGVDNLSLYL